MKTTLIFLLAGLIAVAANVNLEDIDRLANVKLGSGQTRKPRLFLVTTASTTSTVAVTTTCWFTAACVAAVGVTCEAPSGTCTGRKRRSIQETIGKKFDFDIAPTQDVDISADDHIQDQPDSGLKNDEQLMENESQRTGRQNFFNFLLYWATTTTTITSNSTVNGIVTISLPNAGCLPSGVSSMC